MATLDDLLKTDGVVAAFELAPDGKLVACKARADASPEEAAISSQFCSLVTMLFNATTGPFTDMGRSGDAEAVGWEWASSDWTVVIARGHGVLAHPSLAGGRRAPSA